MDYNELIKPGIGAIMGFFLAQFVNFAKIISEWFLSPRLSVEFAGDKHLLLAHDDQVSQMEFLAEKIFGFHIRNKGRTIATGVKFQLIRIQQKNTSDDKPQTISEHAYSLGLYEGAGRPPVEFETTLVPGASVTVKLAAWREDYDTIFPAVSGLPDYYEEMTAGSEEYLFTIVAFDDRSNFAQKLISIKL